DEMAKLADVKSLQQIIDIVNVFRQKERNFLTLSPNENSQQMIDISHESLLYHWDDLKKWTEDEAERANVYRHLENTAILWEKDEATLWNDPTDINNIRRLLEKLTSQKLPDLTNIEQWRTCYKQVAPWAKRYGKDKGIYFRLAIRFLVKSDIERQQKEREVLKEIEKKKQAEEKERKIKEAAKQRNFRISLVAIVILCVSVIGIYVERNKAIQQEQIAIQIKLDSQLNNIAWLAKFNDYQAAKIVLKEISKEKLLTLQQNTYNLLSWFNNLMSSDAEYIYEGAEAALYSVAINNSYLAVAGENGTVALFDVNTGKLLQRLYGHEGHVKAVVFHPQGKWLASAGYDKQIIVWSLADYEKLKELKTPDKVWVLAASPDGNYIASGGKDNNVILWNLATDSELVLAEHKDDIRGLAFSSNGKLASASDDKTVRLWDIETKEELHVLTDNFMNGVNTVAFSPDNKFLASGSEDAIIRLWEANSGKPKQLLNGHKKSISGLKFSTDGRYIISASDDSTLRVWDVNSGTTVQVLQGHTANINDVVISPAGKIFSVSNDATIRRWNLPYQQDIEFTNKPLSTAIAPDGNSVAVGFTDGMLRLYSLPETKLLWETTAHTDELRRIAFNQDSSLLATASADKTAKLWQNGKLLQTFIGHEKTINSIAFTSDNKTLATASFDGLVGLFTIGTEQKSFYKPYDGKDVNSIDVNGINLLITGDNDVSLWNLDKELLLEKHFDTKLIWSALSSDGKKIATVGRDQLVHVYSTTDKSIEPTTLKGHENTVYRAIFSTNGQQIATVSSDATLRMWDLRYDMELFSLRLPTNSGRPVPLKDFNFRCYPKGNCWISVPLIESNKLMLYQLENIYENIQ
ncbi:WD40 repeat domain-containing protein, partial [Thiotrichales bacterium HSG1]|nr:WD40 repeat domain-containing protein [Thiotrichales bacterium HSG1]